MDESYWDVCYWATEKRTPPGRWTGSRLLEKLKAHARNEGKVVKRPYHSVQMLPFSSIPPLGFDIYIERILVYDILITDPLPQRTSFHTCVAVICRPNHLPGSFCPVDRAGAPRIHCRACDQGHCHVRASIPQSMSITGIWLEWVWEAIVEPTCTTVREAKR